MCLDLIKRSKKEEVAKAVGMSMLEVEAHVTAPTSNEPAQPIVRFGAVVEFLAVASKDEAGFLKIGNQQMAKPIPVGCA